MKPPPASPSTSPRSPQPLHGVPQSRTGSGPLRRRGAAQRTASPPVGWFLPPATMRRTLQRIPCGPNHSASRRGGKKSAGRSSRHSPPRPAAICRLSAHRPPAPAARTARLTQLLPAGSVHLPPAPPRPSANVEQAGPLLRMRCAAPGGGEP